MVSSPDHAMIVVSHLIIKVDVIYPASVQASEKRCCGSGCPLHGHILLHGIRKVNFVIEWNR